MIVPDPYFARFLVSSRECANERARLVPATYPVSKQSSPAPQPYRPARGQLSRFALKGKSKHRRDIGKKQQTPAWPQAQPWEETLKRIWQSSASRRTPVATPGLLKARQGSSRDSPANAAQRSSTTPPVQGASGSAVRRRLPNAGPGPPPLPRTQSRGAQSRGESGRHGGSPAVQSASAGQESVTVASHSNAMEAATPVNNASAGASYSVPVSTSE